MIFFFFTNIYIYIYIFSYKNVFLLPWKFHTEHHEAQFTKAQLNWVCVVFSTHPGLNIIIRVSKLINLFLNIINNQKACVCVHGGPSYPTGQEIGQR